MTTAQTRTTLTADGVDFIDKDDTWRCFLRLFEHITDTGRTHTHEHFDEVRTGNGEERYFRLTGNRFCQQRFTGTRRPHHQNTFRNFTAEFLEAARLTQILHQLTNFFFGLITTGHIRKGGFDLIFGQHACLTFTEGHRTFTAAALHLAHEEDPDAD